MIDMGRTAQSNQRVIFLLCALLGSILPLPCLALDLSEGQI